jgi:hypothetical protein
MYVSIKIPCIDIFEQEMEKLAARVGKFFGTFEQFRVSVKKLFCAPPGPEICGKFNVLPVFMTCLQISEYERGWVVRVKQYRPGSNGFEQVLAVIICKQIVPPVFL